MFEYQKPHIQNIKNSLLAEGVAVDMSDTGTGKSYTTAQVVKGFNYSALVVCPLAVVPMWHEVLSLYGVTVLDVLTYEKIRLGNTPWLKVSKIRKKVSFEWVLPSKSIIVFDEAHKCGGINTLNSKLLSQTKAQGVPIIMLSATLADSPLRMQSIGYILKLHRLLDFPYWIKKHGCSKNFWNTWEFVKGNRGKKIMDTINKSIVPKYGGRMRIKELGNLFPSNLIIPESVKLSEERKLSGLYLKAIDRIEGTEYKTPSYLTEFIQARRVSEVLKIQVIMDDVWSLLEEGKHLAIFVSFKETVKLLSSELSSKDVPYGIITGDINKKDREEVVKQFQADILSVVVCTSEAGGIGISLHDLHGKYPRVSLITPPLSAVTFKQVLGRIHRAGAKSPAIQKVLFASGTVEERAYHRVKGKLANLDALNDGDLLGEE